MGRTLIDTNVLVYAFSTDSRMEAARGVLRQGFTIGVQGLNEFTRVARRKLQMSWDDLHESRDLIVSLCDEVVPITMETHRIGTDVIERYGVGMFDGFMIAAALQSRCTRLLSEDMHHGLVVDGRLTIVNPFLG